MLLILIVGFLYEESSLTHMHSHARTHTHKLKLIQKNSFGQQGLKCESYSSVRF